MKLTILIAGDILRNKIIVAYTILLAILSWSVFNLEDTGGKAQLTLLSFILLVVPLVSILFAAIYMYNSVEFIELLLTQPLRRSKVWLSFFGAIAMSMMLAFLFAAGLPLLMLLPMPDAGLLIVTASMLSVIFCAMGVFAAIYCRDKARGIGLSIIIWIYLTMLFDGLVLFLLFQFSDYPIEKPMLFLTASNPVDLVRIMNLMQLEATSLLGFTGAVFKDYFGSYSGTIAGLLVLLLWIIIPCISSIYIFNKKDI